MLRRFLVWLALLPSAVIAGTGVALAAAAVDRVVVVVDSSAGIGLDGDAVRRAIGDELRVPVVAPSDPVAGDTANILVVSVEEATIRMTLRSNRLGPTTRTIPASPDRTVRLRDIGWLAGNLLRDQVSPIVVASPALPEARSASATEPPPLPADATPQAAASSAPNPVRTGGAAAPPVDALAARGSPPPGARHPEWIIGALAGPALVPNDAGFLASAYQLDVQRRASPRAMTLGAALQAGYAWEGKTLHLVGLGVLAGKEWRGTRGLFEVAGVAGVEIARAIRVGTSSCTNPCPVQDKVPPGVAPVLFSRLSATAGISFGSGIDLVFRLAGQFSSLGILHTSAAATAGLRFRL